MMNLLRSIALAMPLVLVACDAAEPPVVRLPASGASASVAVATQPTAAGLAIAGIDQQIEATRARAEGQPSWLHLGSLAELHLARARLSGSVDDYVAAEAALGEAFARAPRGSGPLLTRASFSMTVHRPLSVEADLVAFERRPVKKDHELALIAGLRGDVALQRGDLADARVAYERAEATRPDLTTAGRLANYYRMRGDFPEAAKWCDVAITRAERRDLGQRAWALVQRGVVEMEQARPKAALRYFEQADGLFDGWFLVETHVAQAKLALGEVDQAIELYESIAARVGGGAQLAAVADAYEASGDLEQARGLRARATAAFERDIARMESLVAAHAQTFFLATDPARAMELARRAP